VELDRVSLPIFLATNKIIQICSELELKMKIASDDRENSFTDSSNAAQIKDDIYFAKKARALIVSRFRRQKYFPKAEFFEPVWDICLDLFFSEMTGRRISISSACIASQVPPTTALRYISQMRKDGLITSHPDKLDKRRVYLRLSNQATKAMKEYLVAEIGDQP
jgi:hypothetical protein